MPIKRTTVKGKPAFKYGDKGKAYLYTPGDKASMEAARRKAEEQGRAITARRGGKR